MVVDHIFVILNVTKKKLYIYIYNFENWDQSTKQTRIQEQ